MRALEEVVVGQQPLDIIDGVHPVAQIVQLTSALGDGGVGVDAAPPPVDGCLEHVHGLGPHVRRDHHGQVLVGHIRLEPQPRIPPEARTEDLVPRRRVVHQTRGLVDRRAQPCLQNGIAMRSAGLQVNAVVAHHVAGGEVGAGLLQCGQQDPEPLRGHDVVAVHERQKLLGHVCQAEIPRPAGTASRPLDDHPALVFGGVLPADESGVVGRSVIDQDDLGRLQLLGEQRIQAGRQELRHVVAGDDHTEPHRDDSSASVGVARERLSRSGDVEAATRPARSPRGGCRTSRLEIGTPVRYRHPG